MIDRLANCAWRVAFDLESARQKYSDRRQLLRQAGACVALALVRALGLRV